MAIEQPNDASFACELLAWLKRKKLAYSTHLYSHREWVHVRGERQMHESPHVAWVLTIEGSPLYYPLNGYGDARSDTIVYQAFTKFCEERLWWWEMGYSWSVSLGPITDPEQQAALAQRLGLR